MNKCKICGEPLSTSIYSKDRNYKSCPKCSQENGMYHVFYPYPDNFGTTKKRSSLTHPEGPQSHCEKCRGGNPPVDGILCKDIDIR